MTFASHVLAVTRKELRQIRRDVRTLSILLFVPAFFLFVGLAILASLIRHAILSDLDLGDFRLLTAVGTVLFFLGKQYGYDGSGWREASSPYGEDGSFRSVADIASPESLTQVRE